MGDKLDVRNITGEKSQGSSSVDDRRIRAGSRLSMHFALHLESGETVDSNFGQNPVTLIVGDGNLPPGFERVLLGHLAGEKFTRTLASDQAFGARNEENVRCYPQYQFPADLVLEPGVMVAFGGAGAGEQAGVIVAVEKSTVTVDFNHPLAGRSIVFEVHVLSVDNRDNELTW